MTRFDAARRVIVDGLEAHVYPAAAIEVGTADRLLWRDAFGRLTYEPDAAATTIETVFDLASLTKVVAAVTVAMHLADRGRLQIDAPVHDWIADWHGDDRRGVTVADLLEHCSGLPGWLPLFRECASPPEYRRAIAALPLDYPPRTGSSYSDLGFILLGMLLEDAGNARLDQLWRAAAEPVLGDLDRLALRYAPPPAWRARIAPTRRDPWRGRLLSGEVDDGNAWALGGVAGHSGLFGTVAGVGRFAQAVLGALVGRASTGPPIASDATVRRFVTPSSVPASSRALGWDTMRPTSSCGTLMSSRAVGHTGFTGTSLWIDPDAGLYVVFLTNRVHPAAGDGELIQRVRRALHDAIMRQARP